MHIVNNHLRRSRGTLLLPITRWSCYIGMFVVGYHLLWIHTCISLTNCYDGLATVYARVHIAMRYTLHVVYCMPIFVDLLEALAIAWGTNHTLTVELPHRSGG